MGRDHVLQLRATAEQRQLIDQPAAAEGTSRTEFMLRSCQKRAREVLLDRTLFSLTPQQSEALLTDLQDPALAERAQASFDRLLAAPRPWHAAP